jgi:META domain
MADRFVFRDQNRGNTPLMPHVRGVALALILCLLTGSGYASVCPEPERTTPQAAAMWRRLAEASVAGVYDHPVHLSRGQFVGTPFVAGGHSRPTLRLWPELFATGEMDSVPGDEIIGLLSETSGGSGERVYLLAAKASRDTLSTLPAQLVGDRVKVRALQIKDRQIFLDIVEAGKQEPLCCGTTLTRLVWTLQPEGLRLVEKKSQGQLSLRMIEGQTWQLVDNGTTEPRADSDCTTLTISGGKITGYTGGEDYSGKIIESAPGRIAISQLVGSVGAPQEALPAQEGSYFSLLSSVTQYTFLAGRLALVGFQAGRPVSLKFAPARTGSP